MSGVTRNDLREMMKGIAPVIKEYVQCEIAPIRKRLIEIETKGVEYRGVYQRAISYQRGALVTHGGSMFCAIKDVTQGVVPGQSNDWQLCVKAGRDAR